jgi:uncharacterized protein
VTPRAVLDTNVIVSGLGWRGAPAAILDAVGDGQLVLVTSAPLLAELRRVLEYPKLAKVIQGGALLADLVAASGVVVVPSRVLTVVSDDDDNRGTRRPGRDFHRQRPSPILHGHCDVIQRAEGQIIPY